MEGEDVRLVIRRSMFASKNLKVGDVLKDSDILYLETAVLAFVHRMRRV